MELLPEEVRRLLPPLYSQEHEADPMVYVKFFHPNSHWTWYATEFDGTNIFFGWVYGDFPELGYFSLTELSQAKDPLGIGVERDEKFTPMRLSEVKQLHSATPPRQPGLTIYVIEDPLRQEILETIGLLALHMARLFLALNYTRQQWLLTLDSRMGHVVPAAYERATAMFPGLENIEGGREIFVTAFSHEIVSLCPDYLLKWYRKHGQQKP